MINGGRLFFNAKKDSAFISAKESIGLNARTLNLDATDYFCVDAKKIYLGKAARASVTKEPVVLGTQLENWLNNLVTILSTIASTLPTVTSTPAGAIPGLAELGKAIEQPIRDLTTTTILFQSKKVFTE
jgi:hypothetical protein